MFEVDTKVNKSKELNIQPPRPDNFDFDLLLSYQVITQLNRGF
jgi:hypothetical protein